MSVRFPDTNRLSLLGLVGLLHAGIAAGFMHAGPRRAPVPLQSIETYFVATQSVDAVPTPVEHANVVPVVTTIEAPRPTLPIAPAPIQTLAGVGHKPSSASTAITASISSEPLMIESVEYATPPSPRYPHLSRRLREEGTVLLRVLVDERGDAARIEVADSSGFERLDHAAVEAVARATFRPYIENGAARAVFVLIPIEFGVKRDRG